MTKTPKRKPDKYDRAIAYLRKHPGRIFRAWIQRCPSEHVAHCLFQFATKDGKNGDYGCLTQIKVGTRSAPSKLIERAIRRDKMIPKYSSDITPKHLPRFAYWQRKLDKILKRK